MSINKSMNHQLGIYKRCLYFVAASLFYCGSAYSAVQTYTVGPAPSTYTTMALAYAACNTPGDSYILEIKTSYVSTVEASLPIVLGQKNNLGVTIRPLGTMTISTSTTGSYLFNIDGGDNITIDGRVGSAGASALTLSNTSASGTACLRFGVDASNNTVKHCTVIAQSAATLGVIYFSNVNTGTTGCDNNTIDNCTIRAGASKPAYGIRSAGISATEGHDNTTISNCNILDFTTYGVYLESWGTAWSVTGNSFYQSASYTPTVDMAMVYLNAGTNHTVSGNFMGGQAPNCAGSPFTLSASAKYMTCISTYTSTAGTCTINGNTIKNFNITTNGSPVYCFRGIYCAGSANFIVGATGAGNGNAIGDTVSGTGNITVTAGGTPTEIFSGIYSAASGTHNISGNSMGSLTFNGAATTSASVTFIAATASSSSTIQRNTIGNATANNISFPVTTSHYDFQGITCAAGASAIDYNTIRNINNLGNTQLFQNGIEVTGSALASVSYNSLTSIVVNSPLYAINATSTYAANTCTVNGNAVKTVTVTVTTSVAGYPLMGIRCDGSANFNIGASGAGNGNCIGDTVSGTGNITITASGAQSHIFRGIRISSTGTNSVKYNAIGSITCNGSGTGTPQSRFIEVVGTAPATGATTVQYNTIGNPATLANISFPVAGNLYGYCGIVYDANSNGNISYNKFQNISNLGTGDVGENECIKVTGDGTYTVSYNTVGNTTANNIVYASNMLMHGIWFTNTTGTFTAQGNYIQNFNCTSTGAATYYHGQCIDGGGSVNFTQDTVRNITIAGTNTTSPDCLIQGLRVINNSANQVIDKCAVKDMTSTSTTASITMIGIYTGPTGSCTGDLTRCHVSGLAVASNGATAKNYGMYLAASGSWNVYNNVVLLDNGGNYSPTIGGIVSASTGASTLNIFHNSVKIYGTGSSSTADLHSMPYYRLSAGASSITNVKNNVWQNLRTGGTGNHYACRMGITSNLTCDYNYLENTVAATFAYSGGDIGSLAAWNALAYVGTDLTGTVTLENVKGFSSNAPIPNGGIAPLTPAVTEDKEAYVRANPNPWIGAWENLPSTLPVEMLSFRAACKEGEGELKWTTATETNNNYFSIERSTDGKEFQPIGKVYGAGNSSVSRSYEFIDNEIISNGILFYRIRQVDYDSQYEYFGLVSVRCNSSGIEINPTVSDGVFFITGDISKAEISVCSVIGKNIFFGARQLLISAIDLSSQASGIYFVRIKTEQGVEVKKIVVKH